MTASAILTGLQKSKDRVVFFANDGIVPPIVVPSAPTEFLVDADFE